MLAALAVGCATTRTGTIVSVSPVAYLQPDSSMAVGMDTEIIVPGVHCLAERGLSCSGTAAWYSTERCIRKKRKEKGY